MSNTATTLNRVSFTSTLLLMLLLVSGCGNPIWLPPAHKIELQQGNLLTQEQIESIKTGMQREEVRALIGEPVSTSFFRESRWDYTFTRGPVGSVLKPRRFTVVFDGQTVAKTEDNFEEETGQRVIRKTWWQRWFPTES